MMLQDAQRLLFSLRLDFLPPPLHHRLLRVPPLAAWWIILLTLLLEVNGCIRERSPFPIRLLLRPEGNLLLSNHLERFSIR